MQAIFRNKTGQQIEVRFIAEEDKYFLELHGARIPFTTTLNDLELGLMNLVDDPRRLVVIEEINESVYRFPERSLDDFLDSHREFLEAFRNDFAELAFSKIIYFSKQLSEEAEQLEMERLSRICGDPFSIDEGAV